MSLVICLLEFAIKTANISANCSSIGILWPFTKVFAISVTIEYLPLILVRQLSFKVNTSDIRKPVLNAIQMIGIIYSGKEFIFSNS